MAVVFGVDLQVAFHGVESSLLVLGQLVTGSHSSVIQGIGVLDLINGHIQEVVSPGGTGLLIENLIVQRLVDIQQVANPAAVLVVVVVDDVDVEVVQLHSVQLVIAHGDGVGITVDDGNGCGNAENADHDADDEQHDDPEGPGVSLQSLGFLLSLLLTLGHSVRALLFAHALLVGCTHGINSSRFLLVSMLIA